MHFRQGIKADYGEINRLVRETQEDHAAALPDFFALPNEVVGKAWFETFLHHDRKRIFVVEQDGRLIGVAMCELRDAPEYRFLVPRRFAVVYEFCITAALRRQGIGSLLFNHVKEWASANGATAVELEVWEFNQRAIAFYEQMGMQTQSRTMSVEL